MIITIKKKWINRIGIALIFGVIMIGGFSLFTSGITGYSTNPSSNPNPEDYNEIKIPLSELTKEAKFYEYNSDGVIIKFFAVKASDGSIKTAFNACDVCYKYKKGYRQEGNDMVCNNCGKRYPINGIGKENVNPGGCWPGYLPNSINGSNLIIKKSDLEKGKWRFI